MLTHNEQLQFNEQASVMRGERVTITRADLEHRAARQKIWAVVPKCEKKKCKGETADGRTDRVVPSAVILAEESTREAARKADVLREPSRSAAGQGKHVNCPRDLDLDASIDSRGSDRPSLTTFAVQGRKPPELGAGKGMTSLFFHRATSRPNTRGCTAEPSAV